MEWKPASIEKVKAIVEDDLRECDDEQLAAFRTNRVEPHRAAIVRYGKKENVVVVAQRGNEVVYWEDVEEGFNLSPIDSNGRILEHSCNQDSLGTSLNGWITGRARPPRLGPATAIE